MNTNRRRIVRRLSRKIAQKMRRATHSAVATKYASPYHFRGVSSGFVRMVRNIWAQECRRQAREEGEGWEATDIAEDYPMEASLYEDIRNRDSRVLREAERGGLDIDDFTSWARRQPWFSEMHL